MQRAGAGERVLERRHLAEDDLEELAHLGQELLRRLVAAERLDVAGRLDERVVRDRRHRGVAAATAHVHAKRGAHLLADAAEVEDLAAEHAPLAAALVERVVAADEVRVLPREPGEPEVEVDLLVGGEREHDVASRPEALRAPARRRRPPLRRRGPSCRARPAPTPRRRRGRPTTGRAPTPRRPRRRCRCARSARWSARHRPAAARRGSRAPASSPPAATRRRSARGSRAAAPPPASRSRVG